MEDIIIIGAGVTGCAIARELSRDQRKILVLEKGSDVCVGTSKANSGIVHAGHDAKPGTLKAKLNLEGNLMMPQLAKDLDIPFVQNGSSFGRIIPARLNKQGKRIESFRY